MDKYKGLAPKSISLVGLMGAGKSRVGVELAKILDLPFYDADNEIERAAGCGIADFFDHFGEIAFRQGERKVIRRLLSDQTCVLATGGGAFVQEETRRLIKKQSISVWLKADIDILVNRTSRLDRRPLLKGGDRRDILANLINERSVFYGQADVMVEVLDVAPKVMAGRIAEALFSYLNQSDKKIV